MTIEKPRRAHRPPSRIRYDQTHPVLGTRVSRRDYDAVKAFQAKNGWSFAKFIRIALQRESSKYDNAWKAGFAAAKHKYAVHYGCSVCGGLIPISTGEEAQVAIEAMERAQWGHAQCINQNGGR